MEKEKGGMSGFWYFVGGAAVGAAAGVLFAPRPGSETRASLEEWRKQNGEKAKGLISRISEKIPARVKAAAFGGAVKSGVSEAAEIGTEKAKDFVGA
ncbi:MAG: YtxH domain-containing protein [Elusimicrobiota bacterium]|nr:MAG: YtxH domain-containing protein [Elusimicrobiota bacterium]